MSKILLQAPEGITDCSFGGENYAVVDGVVEVPAEAAASLYQFGFANVPAVAATREQGDLSDDVPSDDEPSSETKTEASEVAAEEVTENEAKAEEAKPKRGRSAAK